MPRSVGYNVIGWNEAPWAKSGYYAASDTLPASYDITTPMVAGSQSAAFDVTNPVADAQAVGYDIRQIAADSQAVLFDVTNPVADAQAIVFDVTVPCPVALKPVRYGVAMSRASAHAALTNTTQYGTLTRRGGNAVLTQINP